MKNKIAFITGVTGHYMLKVLPREMKKIKIARFRNIFGPQGTWTGGKEKAPVAMIRKVCETEEGGEMEVWGDGQQTRSFLYVNECVEAVLRLMNSNFEGPVNIGSNEMVTINELAQMAIDISKKEISIKNLAGDEFFDKYGFKCPTGVRGRNSENSLYKEKIGWEVSQPLVVGMEQTFNWINKLVNSNNIAIALIKPPKNFKIKFIVQDENEHFY